MYNDALGISKIQSYASMFGFDSKSGIETEELEPIISDTDAVRTSIGYYHRFAPIQIARYVTAIANKGTVFDISMIDKEVDKEGNVVHVDEPVVHNQITQFSDAEWNSVQKGMWMVVNTSADSLDKLYKGAGAVVAGKTGTAQVSLNHPNHGLFISYAPYEKPEISVTVVLPNAYTSANAAYVAREVYGLYFKDENKEDLLSGNYTAGNATSINISD
jgi:penicillin-binding protein 2